MLMKQVVTFSLKRLVKGCWNSFRQQNTITDSTIPEIVDPVYHAEFEFYEKDTIGRDSVPENYNLW